MFADIFGTLHYIRDDSSKKAGEERFKCLFSFKENKTLEENCLGYSGMGLGLIAGGIITCMGSSFLIYPVELYYNFIYNKNKRLNEAYLDK